MARIEGDPGLFDIAKNPPAGWNELGSRAELLVKTSSELGVLGVGVSVATAKERILGALQKHWRVDPDSVANTFFSNPGVSFFELMKGFNEHSKREDRPGICVDDLTRKISLEPFAPMADREDESRGIAVRALLGSKLFVPKGDVDSAVWKDEIARYEAGFLTRQRGEMAYDRMTPKDYMTLAAQRRLADEPPLGAMRFPDLKDKQNRYLTMRTDWRGKLVLSETEGAYDKEIGVGITATLRNH